jgi:hypothetical protein
MQPVRGDVVAPKSRSTHPFDQASPVPPEFRVHIQSHRTPVAVGPISVGLLSCWFTLSCAVVATSASATEPAAAPSQAVADDPECLAINRSSSSTYMIANQNCPEFSVLASIELAEDGAIARCFTKKIRSQISIASEGAVPHINYQCIEGAGGCSMELLRGMFPECHSG